MCLNVPIAQEGAHMRPRVAVDVHKHRRTFWRRLSPILANSIPAESAGVVAWNRLFHTDHRLTRPTLSALRTPHKHKHVHEQQVRSKRRVKCVCKFEAVHTPVCRTRTTQEKTTLSRRLGKALRSLSHQRRCSDNR